MEKKLNKLECLFLDHDFKWKVINHKDTSNSIGHCKRCNVKVFVPSVDIVAWGSAKTFKDLQGWWYIYQGELFYPPTMHYVNAMYKSKKLIKHQYEV